MVTQFELESKEVVALIRCKHKEQIVLRQIVNP